jgi:hypothetical protein
LPPVSLAQDDKDLGSRADFLAVPLALRSTNCAYPRLELVGISIGCYPVLMSTLKADNW